MKSSLFTTLLILIVVTCYSQSYPKEYYLLKRQIDTFWTNKEYKKGAVVYSTLFELMGSKAENYDRMIAAGMWAMANYPDSAYKQLDIAASNGRYVDFGFTNGTNLKSLHNDKRWKDFVDRIKKFDFPPSLCKHILLNPPPISVNYTIDKKSKLLNGDGFGPYPHDKDYVRSVSTHAYNFIIKTGENGESSKRFLKLDLSKPIKSSGAVSQGVIIDHYASFHVFYKLDTTVKPWVVYNFRDMPIGEIIKSPRTEIFVHISGVRHVLQLGFWGLGDCNEEDGKGGRNGGAGTTSVEVTRHSEKSYTIVAPKGSMGRLWDVSNSPNTIDKGLFKMDFIVHLQYQ